MSLRNHRAKYTIFGTSIGQNIKNHKLKLKSKHEKLINTSYQKNDWLR